MYWIDESALFNREMTYTTRMTLKHYINNRGILKKIMVGVVDECNGSPVMNWNCIEDWGTESLMKYGN